MPSPTVKNKISVSLTDEAAAIIEKSAGSKGIGISEAIRRAIAVYGFVEAEREAGSTFLLRRPDGELERVQFVFG